MKFLSGTGSQGSKKRKGVRFGRRLVRVVAFCSRKAQICCRNGIGGAESRDNVNVDSVPTNSIRICTGKLDLFS